MHNILFTVDYTMASKSNALGYPVLETKTPVPSDIEVSQDIVQKVGLLEIPQVAAQ